MTNVEEQKEEELEVNEPENEPGANETEGDEEPEVEDSSDVSDDDGGTDGDETGGDGEATEERKRRATAQIDRLKKENEQLKEKLKEGGKESVTSNPELVERTYLAANGIKERTVQDEVMRLAKKFEMSVDDAMQDADIKERADKLTKNLIAQRSISNGTGGASMKKKGESYYLAHFKRTGDFPEGTPQQMIAKVTDMLAEE